MNRLVYKAHKWVGATLVLWLALQAATGFLLTFRHGLERTLQPGLVLAAGGPALPPGALAARLAETFPDAALTRLRLPRAEDEVAFATLKGPEGEFFAALEPATGAVRRAGGLAAFPFEAVFALHHDLLMGEAGKTVVGLLGAVYLLVLVPAGLYLWWPPTRRAWRRAFKVRTKAGFRAGLGDAHKVTGAVAALLMLASAATGVGLAFSGPVGRALSLVLPYEAGAPALPADAAGADVGIDAAVSQALAALPPGRVKEVRPRGGRLLHVLVWPEEPARARAVHHAWVDRAGGTVLGTRLAGLEPAANRAVAWFLPLHTGEAAGLPGRLAVAAAGLALFGISISGGTIWYMGWRNRARNRARTRAAVVRDAA
ncbi:MAG TPA: PepSY-associated TM helix domain-containing protein [Azospirillaceae bacterium]|nr:PepSY-associated TM helix domain-containing protein [Azospirillaceae bacterium]